MPKPATAMPVYEIIILEAMSKDLEKTATRSRGEVMGLRLGRKTKETMVLPPKNELAETQWEQGSIGVISVM